MYNVHRVTIYTKFMNNTIKVTSYLHVACLTSIYCKTWICSKPAACLCRVCFTKSFCWNSDVSLTFLLYTNEPFNGENLLVNFDSRKFQQMFVLMFDSFDFCCINYCDVKCYCCDVTKVIITQPRQLVISSRVSFRPLLQTIVTII